MTAPRRTIRASFADRSAVDPLARLEIHTNDLLACLSAVLDGLDIAPGLAGPLDPEVRQFINDATRQHVVGDHVILAIVFRPGETEANVSDRLVLQRDLNPVGEQRVHSDSLAESNGRSKAGEA